MIGPALWLLLALSPAPQQHPCLQFGGMFPGVPWKGIHSYIAQKAPSAAVCHATAEIGGDPRTRTCSVKRLLLTNDIRANVTFTVDDSSGNVSSIVIAWHPARERARTDVIDSLTTSYGAPDGTDSTRAAAEWHQGGVQLKATAHPSPGTSEGGVADPIVVMLISTPLQHAIDSRLTTTGTPSR